MMYPKHYFRSFVCLVFLSFFSVHSRASHIVGADLRYEWVSGDTYKIILAVYADCGPSSAAAFATLPSATPKVCVFNGSTAVTTLTLAIDSPSTGLEVTPTLCPGDSSQCMSPTSYTPGIKLFMYSTTYTLPSASAVWRFVFNGNYTSSSAGRAGTITNLSGGTTMQLIDTLNNMTGHNSNPVLHVIPLPYYGNHMPHTYNPAAVDADGDSLVYTLTAATNGTGTCGTVGAPVSYASGTSSSAPLQTAAGAFGFDPTSGQMAFLPNVYQRGVVVYNISEYRGGVLVGTIQRELTVLIIGTTNHLPIGGLDSATVGTIVDTLHYMVCTTAGAFTASIHSHDTDATDSITVSALGLPAGATFTTVNNGTMHPISTLSWNTTGVTPGTYTFYVTYTDNSCPMAGAQTVAYHITIVATPCLPSTGVEDMNRATGIAVYPNPSAGTFTIEVPATVKTADITVCDLYGRVAQSAVINATSGKLAMDLSRLPQGTYVVKVVAGGNTYREKILISK